MTEKPNKHRVIPPYRWTDVRVITSKKLTPELLPNNEDTDTVFFFLSCGSAALLHCSVYALLPARRVSRVRVSESVCVCVRARHPRASITHSLAHSCKGFPPIPYKQSWCASDKPRQMICCNYRQQILCVCPRTTSSGTTCTTSCCGPSCCTCPRTTRERWWATCCQRWRKMQRFLMVISRR